MAYQEIEHGQPQWESPINAMFKELYDTSQALSSKTSLSSERLEEKDGLVLTNGWQKNECYIDVLPLVNGKSLKICHLSISHPQLAPTGGATLLIVPSDANILVPQFVGGSENPGFYGADASHIDYFYHPADGKAHDVTVNTTFMYF